MWCDGASCLLLPARVTLCPAPLLLGGGCLQSEEEEQRCAGLAEPSCMHHRPASQEMLQLSPEAFH